MKKAIPILLITIVGWTLIGASETVTKPPARVSFATDVLPIMLKSCATAECHGDMQPPMLLTHKKISKYSKRIKARITNEKRPMPPLDSDKKLTKDEMDLLLAWIEQGSPNN